jgi:hypothetical protein
MTNDEFIKHCEGLNDKLSKNDIVGFYFFINNLSKKGNKIGTVAACDFDNLPKVFQNIFILIHCLNNEEVSKTVKINISKALDMMVNIASIDLKDVTQKGENNG